MNPSDRATAPAGLQRSKILSAGAIGFPMPDGPPLHTPTFRHPETPEGCTYCIGCERFIVFEDMAKACPGKETA